MTACSRSTWTGKVAVSSLPKRSTRRSCHDSFDVVFSPSQRDNQPVPTPDVLAVYAEAGVTWWLENGTTLDQTRGRAREGTADTRLTPSAYP